MDHSPHAGDDPANTHRFDYYDKNGNLILSAGAPLPARGADGRPIEQGQPVHLGGCDLNYGTSDGKGGLVPPPIQGRRTLSAYELALIERIKQLGHEAELLQVEVEYHLKTQHDEAKVLASVESDPALAAKGKAELERLQRAEPFRHLALYKTHFQDAAMRLSRAVAQPSTFA